MISTKLTFIDWAIIVAYLVIVVALGLLFTRRASKSMEEFFVSGRSLPWWLAGTSIVATSSPDCTTPAAGPSASTRCGCRGR